MSDYKEELRREWEEEVEIELPHTFIVDTRSEIFNFWLSKIAEREQELKEKIVGMKKYLPKRGVDELGRPLEPRDLLQLAEDRGYNNAVDSVLSLFPNDSKQ